MTKLEEQIAKEVAAPIILKLLKTYSTDHINYAISNNVNLTMELKNDPEYLAQIRNIAYMFPFTDKAAKEVPKKKWIQWFLNNECKHKRPDLYAQIIYHPLGPKYITRQIRNIVKLVYE